MIDLSLVGIAIVLAGFLVVLVAVLSSAGRSGDRRNGARTKGGGLVLIGPIPIIFGSNWKWAGVAMVLGVVAMVVIVLLTGILIV